MEEILKDHLTKDEKILWSGAPESFEPMDKTHKNNYIRRAVLSIAIAAAVLVAYVIAAGRSNVSLNIWIFVVILAAGLYGAALPFLDCNKLKTKVKYVVTDRRMFMVNGSDIRNVSLDAIGQAKLLKDEDGHQSLVCGSEANKIKASKLRVATLTGAMLDDQKACERFVFYAVEDVEGLKASLSQASQGRLALSA